MSELLGNRRGGVTHDATELDPAFARVFAVGAAQRQRGHEVPVVVEHRRGDPRKLVPLTHQREAVRANSRDLGRNFGAAQLRFFFAQQRRRLGRGQVGEKHRPAADRHSGST